MKTHSRRPAFQVVAVSIAFALVSLSCSLSLVDWSLFTPATPVAGGGGSGPTATPAPLAEITFSVILPTPLAPGETVYLSILDEVTGLGLNPQYFAMQSSDSLRYTLKFPLPIGTVIKYRYVRQGGVLVPEYTSFGQPVRYRLYHIGGPAIIEDIISSWGGQPMAGSGGNLRGIVKNAQSGQPVPNIMVAAGGQTTLTDSLGQYVLMGLPPGTHNISAYALDGAYGPFHQGAALAPGLWTDAPLNVQPASMVQVTFVVRLPANTVKGAPVRLAGNLAQFGNTFADLMGGVNTLSTRMPVLSARADGRYEVILRLPVGADIRYKYTLGDGYWNAEHDSDGKFLVRQFIVPSKDLVINDSVTQWEAGNSAPVLFEVTVPPNTPAGDTVSLQLNTFGWTEPLPMWPMGGNKWVYKLFGPFGTASEFNYRYCRNQQCGSADDVATAGGNNGRLATTSVFGETISDSVLAWNWWPESEPVTLVTVPVKPRMAGFWAGVEYQASSYSPSWQSLLPDASQSVKNLGANIVVIPVSWTARSLNLSNLDFAPVPGSDPLWNDAFQTVQYARGAGLTPVIYAVPRFTPNVPDFWLNSARSPDWWNAWFERYRAFAIYHADLAAQSGAQALILGGEGVFPALPGGVLANGAPSGVPADADVRWRGLIRDVRTRFGGQILWAHPYSATIQPAPVFIDEFNAIYLLWSAPISVNGVSSVDVMTAEAGRRMDADLLPFLAAVRKNVIIAVDYPSATGAPNGCVPSAGGGCLDLTALSRPYPDIPSVQLNIKAQAETYQAMLLAVNARDWISGFVSRGYYPAAALMDKSSSARGKMAADMLWYWLPRLTGATR